MDLVFPGEQHALLMDRLFIFCSSSSLGKKCISVRIKKALTVQVWQLVDIVLEVILCFLNNDYKALDVL